MKRHIKTGIHTEKWKYLISYINQKIKGFQKIPAVLTDRACKISVLSFFELLLGVHTGRQVGSLSLILWSAAICLFGILHAYHLLRCGEKQEYEIVEGVVYELKGRHSLGRVYLVGICLGDGRAVQLLMDKQYRFRMGGKYRFYFNPKGQNVFFGIKGLDAALNTGSFYGAEELE